MPDPASRAAIVTGWVAVALVVSCAILGPLWYGASEEVRHRFWSDLIERPGGPMAFRFVLQPVMAAIAAVIDGLKDARLGRSPYFWTIIRDSQKRLRRLREGLISTARIILLGIGMDAIYQYKVLHAFYPGEAAIIALTLAVIPYFIIRGPVSRIARRWRSHPASQ